MTATTSHPHGAIAPACAERDPADHDRPQQAVSDEHQLAPVRIGARSLASSGRIWKVRRLTVRGRRVVLTADSPDGDLGMVVDLGALRHMVALDPAATDARTALPAETPSPVARKITAGHIVSDASASTHRKREAAGWPR